MASQATMCYPSEEQHKRWKAEADKQGMSLSEFIQAMTEAGIKKFDVDITPDETKREIRQQRNDLQEQLADARDRIEELEEQAYTTEREEIREYVEDSGGATFTDVVNHVANTAPDRVNQHLEAMNGESLQIDGDEITPKGEA